MRKVFADTLYWLATVRPHDPYAGAAQEARRAIGACSIVTTDEVLGEFVTALAKAGPRLRERAVRIVRELLDSTGVKVLGQSRESFLHALERFLERPDKEYSLTDCCSMNAMDTEGITDVLTHDHHFEQEGYRVLIRAVGGNRPR
ncbi:MAG: type II toxin-antitoxin system VapC family toxin [Pirellulales bacterium]